ncbi:adenosylcobinamide-phosphate synthase CbiB [Methylocapsa sp. S129]|uniref:adenosylcobinamide-phosphate synthase CbiB n=1 Tax=Methylocapsa sp. S129 TaxID=1641869 RepID=UPI0015753909|nr:adenosylcobinamide-phosphate synthase CbiB [Methylocapsa sp. S129]
MHFALSPQLAFAALVIEACAGYPDILYRAIGHPVTWMGAWLAWLDRRLNRPTLFFGARRTAGALALLLLLAPVGGAAALITLVAPPGWIGFLLLAALAASLPAQRSLHDHVGAVAQSLEREGLSGGRRAVAMIVGRNPSTLDEAGVARAAIESLAENFSDGIVAPLFWIVIGGLAGGALYKAVNTADSMIGHRSDRYLAFGWAAARLDDLVNLPASRLAACWIIVAAAILPGASAPAAIAAVQRDARHHRSPNAGWPEAAMAGALALKLAGPRVYGEENVEDAFMGDGRYEANAADIRAGLRLYRVACLLQAIAIGALAFVG